MDFAAGVCITSVPKQAYQSWKLVASGIIQIGYQSGHAELCMCGDAMQAS